MVSQVLQQSLAGSTVEEFVQQHAGPDRNTKLPPLDKPRRCRRANDAAHAPALTRRRIAMAMYHTPVGLDLNLQHLRILRIAKPVECQSAFWALGLVQCHVLVASGQLCLHGAPVSGGSVLLSPWTTTHSRIGLALAMLAPFALSGEYATLQIADLAPCQLQLSLQCPNRLGSTRFEFAQNALVAKFSPFETINRFAMRRLPIVCGRLQRYVHLTGDRHILNYNRWWRLDANGHDGFRQGGSCTHRCNGRGKS